MTPTESEKPVSERVRRPGGVRSNGDRSFTERWKHPELFDGGFVGVPTVFLQLYAQMKPHPITTGEALFILELMAFKWDSSAPFPGYPTLAERMGLSVKMVRRHAQRLEAK